MIIDSASETQLTPIKEEHMPSDSCPFTILIVGMEPLERCQVSDCIHLQIPRAKILVANGYHEANKILGQSAINLMITTFDLEYENGMILALQARVDQYENQRLATMLILDDQQEDSMVSRALYCGIDICLNRSQLTQELIELLLPFRISRSGSFFNSDDLSSVYHLLHQAQDCIRHEEMEMATECAAQLAKIIPPGRPEARPAFRLLGLLTLPSPMEKQPRLQWEARLHDACGQLHLALAAA